MESLTTSHPSERRQHVRYETDLRVLVKVFTGKSRIKSSDEIECLAVNISQAGVCLICDDMSVDGIHLWGNSKLDSRNYLKLQILFPWQGEDERLPIKGMVKYFEKINFRGGERYRVFVEFADLTQIDRIKVARYLEKLEQFLSR